MENELNDLKKQLIASLAAIGGLHGETENLSLLCESLRGSLKDDTSSPEEIQSLIDQTVEQLDTLAGYREDVRDLGGDLVEALRRSRANRTKDKMETILNTVSGRFGTANDVASLCEELLTGLKRNAPGSEIKELMESIQQTMDGLNDYIDELSELSDKLIEEQGCEK